MAYSTLKVWSAYETLGSSDLNANMANLDFLKTQVDVTIAHGRLTLETGVAVSTTDQTAKATLYYTPFNGSKIGLYDGTATSWDLYTFTEASLSLSGYIKGVLYDIYGYLSGGALALESLAWKKITASNSPSAGSSVAINLSDTATLAVGMEVTVKDGSNSEICTITAVSASVSITVATLANSYTTPDVYGYNARATALTLNGGNWVKSGDATRRYLGTIRITATAGQCEDSLARRYVWNLHNQVSAVLKCKDHGGDWSYSTGTWRPANNVTTYGTSRFGFVVGLTSHEALIVTNQQAIYTIGDSTIGIAFDNITANDADVAALYSSTYYNDPHAVLIKKGLLGFHYIQRMEYGNGTTTFYGDSPDNAMFAPFWC